MVEIFKRIVGGLTLPDAINSHLLVSSPPDIIYSGLTKYFSLQPMNTIHAELPDGRMQRSPVRNLKGRKMITKVTVQNFKRFKEPTEFNLQPSGISYIAGGNNSGKSTLLQALAVWEFARSLLEMTKDQSIFQATYNGEGVGVSAEEFSPICLPDLKHLFSNLKTSSGTKGKGYLLRVRCEWTVPDRSAERLHLELAFSHVNDRLFIKPTSSNLEETNFIPRMVYLPPFAGISAREERMLPAVRKRWIGKGLAGAVLRNVLYDLWERSQRTRADAPRPEGKLLPATLAEIRKTDAWEQLSLVLAEVFDTGLTVKSFNEFFHTTIEVLAWSGTHVKKEFKPIDTSQKKDLMVEGGGFLQWLSVYALALDQEYQVLLLDEPDAHLHPELQGHLTFKLNQLARENNKQILLATHSTTILSEVHAERIFRVEDRAYLADDRARIGLFAGLGSQYAPRFDRLKRDRLLFLHDGPSDLEVLQAWAKTLGIAWPQKLVPWKYTKDEAARVILFEEMQAEIHGLRGLSLQDRDNYPYTETKSDLTFGSMPLNRRGLKLRRWRRRNIENYLLVPAAIARAAGRSEKEVRDFLSTVHGISVPDDFQRSDCPQTLANTDGKQILTRDDRSIRAEFGVTYIEIVGVMSSSEIAEDPKTLLQQIVEMCSQ